MYVAHAVTLVVYKLRHTIYSIHKHILTLDIIMYNKFANRWLPL